MNRKEHIDLKIEYQLPSKFQPSRIDITSMSQQNYINAGKLVEEYEKYFTEQVNRIFSFSDWVAHTNETAVATTTNYNFINLYFLKNT